MTITISENRMDIFNQFLSRPDDIKKNIYYNKYIKGQMAFVKDVIKHDDGTVHYRDISYNINRGKHGKYYKKQYRVTGFTVDKSGKMRMWFNSNISSISHDIKTIIKVLNIEWLVKLDDELMTTTTQSYLMGYLVPSILGKIIAGKITNQEMLFKKILSMYGYKNASHKFFKEAIKNKLSKHEFLSLGSVAKDINHFFLSNSWNNGNIHISDMYTQCITLNRKIDYTWSDLRMNLEHNKMTDELMSYELDSLSTTDVKHLVPFKQLETDNIKLLASEIDVFKEGRRMKHCVYTNYFKQMSNGECLLFHFSNPNSEDKNVSTHGATLMLRITNNKAIKGQFLSIRNESFDINKEFPYLNDFIEEVNQILKTLTIKDEENILHHITL